MIIRTSMSNRAAVAKPTAAPKLSDREKKRLSNTKHKTYVPPVVIPKPEEIYIPEPVEEKKETVWVKEENLTLADIGITAEEERFINSDFITAEPGTAIIRSKALEELDQKAEKPKKKYKIISMDKK